MTRAAVVGITTLTLLAGCDRFQKAEPQLPEDDALTIVVQEDRSRIAGQEAALLEQRKRIDEERERLKKEAEKLGEQGGAVDVEALVKEVLALQRRQEEFDSKRDALAQEKEQLIEKVIAKPGSLPAAVARQPDPAARSAAMADREKDVATRERSFAEREREVGAREKALAEREAALASREAEFARRDAACLAAAPARVAPPAADPAARVTRASVERAYKSVLAAMDAKGVVATDLPGGKQQFAAAGAFRGGGDLVKALDAINSVEAAVAAISIDGDFVSKKVQRVNAMHKQTGDPELRKEVAKLLQEVARSYSDGRYPDANRALNSIVLLIQKQGTR